MQFLKSGYLFHAIAIAVLACSVIFIGYESLLWQNVATSKEYLIYSFAVIAVFILANVAIAFLSGKRAKIGVNDAVPFAMIFTSLFLIAYLYFGLKEFTVFSMFAAGSLFLAGDVCLFLNVIHYRFDIDENVIYTSNSFTAYYKTIFKKYPAFYVLLASIVSVCFTTLLFHPTYYFGFETLDYVLIAVLCIPVIVYASYNAANRKIIALDALLSSLVLTMPLSLLQILLFSAHRTRNLFIWGAGLLIAIVYTFIRYKCFDIRKENLEKTVEKKGFFRYYFKSVFANKSILLAIAIGSILTACLTVIFPVELVLQLVVIEKGVFSFHPDVILVLIIDLFAIGVVLFGIATPFVNIIVKKANVGDYVLVATAIFFALSCATLALAFSTIRLIVFGAGLLLTCITIVARAFVLYHH